ncbi:hypothetical protein [Helicobacter sp. 23-1045]
MDYVFFRARFCYFVRIHTNRRIYPKFVILARVKRSNHPNHANLKGKTNQ